MDRPSLHQQRRRWPLKPPSPGPRILLILLLFALPLVLLPAVLGVPALFGPPPRLDPREELSRTLTQQGIVFSDQPTGTNEVPAVEVAGQSINQSPPVEAADETSLLLMDDEGAVLGLEGDAAADVDDGADDPEDDEDSDLS